MGAKLDRSSETIVVWCSSCVYFSKMTFGLAEAYDEAVIHELSQHPGMKDAMSNRANWRKKIASRKA